MITIHDQTKASIIESTANTVGAFLKEVFVHRKNMEQMEAQKEHDVELARIRANAAREDDTEEIVEEVTEAAAEPTAAEIEAAIDDLIDQEMCAVCQDLLRGLKQRPPREQLQGVFEYGQFKDSLSQDAGIDELKDFIAQTEVLHAVLEENLRAPA